MGCESDECESDRCESERDEGDECEGERTEDDGGEGRRRKRDGCRAKNKNPTQICGENLHLSVVDIRIQSSECCGEPPEAFDYGQTFAFLLSKKTFSSCRTAHSHAVQAGFRGGLRGGSALFQELQGWRTCSHPQHQMYIEGRMAHLVPCIGIW